MKTTLNGRDYDLVIIDGDIVAQSLDQDLVFENGYNILRYEAEYSWIKISRSASASYNLNDWISDCTDEHAVRMYCIENVSTAKVVNYNLN